MGCTSSSDVSISRSGSGLSDVSWSLQQDLFQDISVLDPLGSGAHAQVYRGICRRSGRPCAQKVAKPESAALLQTEIAILRQLDHPHITKLLGSGVGPSGPYMVMELCSGGDMFDCLSRERRLSERLAARVMMQLCEAVAYMHARGVCHCDLKEENILIANPGPLDKLMIKVCDLGIARSKAAVPPSAEVLCTLNYAAPEVLAGDAGDEAGDLWSCGVILYSLICGRLPFDDKSRADLLARVKSGGPSFHESTWRSVSEGAVGLIRRLLRLKRDARYTADQALAHPWVARQAPRGEKAEAPVGLLAARPSPAQLVLLDKALQALEGAILPWELSTALCCAGIAEDVVASSQLANAAGGGNGLVDCSAISKFRAERPATRTLLGMGPPSYDKPHLKDCGGAAGLVHGSQSLNGRFPLAAAAI